MVSIIKSGTVNTYVGKSGDTKPAVHVPNGSKFYEMDTGKVYIYDVEDTDWVPQDTDVVLTTG